MNDAALRIALCTHSVNPRGGVVHTLELGDALHRQGCDVTVFAPAAAGDTMFRDTSCRVVLAHVSASERNIVERVAARIDALKRALLDATHAERFDVFHAQDSISGNALAELKHDGSIPGFIRTVHHLDHFCDPQLAQWQQRAWEHAERVLCVSDAWVRTMRDTHHVDAQMVPNGVDTRRFAPASNSVNTADTRLSGIDGSPVVLAIGGIEARKNTAMLLEAFARLRERHPRAQLVIAGGASLLDHRDYAQRFIARAAALGLPIGARQAVWITGPLDDALMPALYRRADVVAMVSLKEGFGLVVLEALASRKPVVVSRLAPFTDYLDARTCYWADPHDVDSIVRSIGSALDPSHPRTIDFDVAVPRLLQRFSWENSASRHLVIYRAWLAESADQRCASTGSP